MIYKFRLLGANEGKTISLDRFNFIDGELKIQATPDDAHVVAKTLRENYNAVPAEEFEAAKKAFLEVQAEAALSEKDNELSGLEESHKLKVTAKRFIDEGLNPYAVYGPGQVADQVQNFMDQIRKESAEQTENPQTENPQTENPQTENPQTENPQTENPQTENPQTENPQANGGGQQGSESAKIKTLADALQALDVSNDNHWTAQGIPSIDALSHFLARRVTRSEVETQAPNFNRSAAKAAVKST